MLPSTTVLIPFLNTDSTEYLEEAIACFDGLPYIVARNDGEMAEALNAALEVIETPFTFVMGADDLVNPGCVEMLESLIWNVDVTYPSMILTNEDLSEVVGTHPALPFDGMRLQQWNFIPGIFLARTEALRAVGGWRDMDNFEDWDLHVRMYRAGYRFKPVPEAEIIYRRRPGSRNSKVISVPEWQEKIVGEVPEPEATFYYQNSSVTTYLRCQLPARYLPGICYSIGESNVVLTDTDAYVPTAMGKAAILQFPGDYETGVLAQVVFPSIGVKTLVEVDDNYLAPTPFLGRQGWTSKIKGNSAHSLEGHRNIVKAADGVIVTTETLANLYGKINGNVHICPNTIEPKDWPKLEKPNDGVLRIGWFASRSHMGDEKLVRRALEWASKQPNTEVVTMGYDPGWKGFRRRHIPWSNDLPTYWKMMMELDIGLAPTVPTLWANCRSDVKALDYTMAGATCILSDVPPYADWDESKALKASTSKDFLRAVQTLVAEPQAARELSRAARDYVLRERTIEANIDRWRAAIAS